MQPEWREEQDGRPVRGGYGGWEDMVRSGRNGFLTVLSSLTGLRDVAEESCWRAALLDVGVVGVAHGENRGCV